MKTKLNQVITTAATLGATSSELSDLDAGAVSHRFYRAVTP
jgi:hypothetical protein